MRLFLHAGLHKTGTTSIQAFMARNSSLLAEHGVCIPRSGLVGTFPETAHHNIAWQLGGFTFDPAAGTLDDLVAELRGAAAPVACVTSESFEHLYKFPGSLREFKDALDRIGYDVRVVLYFKSQVSYAESLYAEMVKHRSGFTLEEFVDRVLSDGEIEFNEQTYGFDYYELANVFAGVFGKSSVVARAVPAEGPASALIADFFEIVCPAIAALNLDAYGAAMRENRRIPIRQVVRSYMDRKVDNGGVSFEKACSQIFDAEKLRSQGGPVGAVYGKTQQYRPFGAATIGRFISRFRETNRRLAVDFGVDVAVCSRERVFAEARSGACAGRTI